jgi:PAS domain S-box-containing protein
MERPIPKFPGYQVLARIHDSSESSGFRSIRIPDGLPVILKLLKPSSATPMGLSRYHNEYEISQILNSDRFLRIYSIEPYGQTVFLVVEDFGGMRLDSMMKQLGQAGTQSFPLSLFLALARQIVEGIGEMHAAGIIHKDLYSFSIVLNPETGQVKICNFDLATTLNRESPILRRSLIPKGPLAYMSPEQSGRMNRTVDYRTDFYSLGVVFYEMLTGRVPFEATDAMELVHAHLARTPVAPCTINHAIPRAVSDIVLKLLAKAPEARYQSAQGIKADLSLCLQQLQDHGKVQEFQLARQDRADRFLIPEKLYGRDKEVALLLSAFERAAQGRAELLLVSGAAGIGKTAVVNEAQKPIAEKHGYFIRGKFDRFKHNIPYSAFVEALRDLMSQLLGESKDQPERRKAGILNALGENGQAIIDVIPELEQIIGPQPAVPALHGIAAQNRFNLLFQKFIRSLAIPEHPLAVFLDDLQWADQLSLELIQQLIGQSGISDAIFFGAYRDSEERSIHSLNRMRLDLEKGGAPLQTIALGPLGLADINQLIADTLACSSEMATPLAELMYPMAEGNPFFNNQLLKSFYEEGLISFDQNAGHWQCDISRITNLSLSDDVVEFLAGQLRKLPAKTQEILKLAACIGDLLDLETLATVSQLSKAATATHLWTATQAGIILPQSEAAIFIPGRSNKAGNPPDMNGEVFLYRFLHERVQRAAYSLIPSEQKEETHLRIGRLLLENTNDIEKEEKIFEIVGQFNRGLNLVKDAAERQRLAELNLKAGQKAKAALAYKAARDYFAIARLLLEEDSWASNYEFTLSLFESSVEAAYFNGDYPAVEELAAIVVKEARSPLDQSRTYEVRMQALAAQNMIAESISAGLKILELLGVVFPEKPDERDIEEAYKEIQRAYRNVRVEKLIEMPLMTDPHQLAIMGIMANLTATAFGPSTGLFSLSVFKMTAISIKYGNAATSALGYALFGFLLCGVYEDIESGYKFAQLALDLIQRLNAKEWHSRVYSNICFLVSHWKIPLLDVSQSLQSAYHIGLETGDFQSAAFSAFLHCAISYFTGIRQDLSELQEKTLAFKESAFQMKQMLLTPRFGMLLQAMYELRNGRTSSGFLKGEFYDEEVMLPRHLQANDMPCLFMIWFHKLLLDYLFGEYKRAVDAAPQRNRFVGGGRGFPYDSTIREYDSLARLAFMRENPQIDKDGHLREIESNQEMLRIWARHAPMNYLHKYQLVEAERYRLLGDRIRAIEAYDQAIAGAKEYGFIREEALGNELAAEFLLDWGKEKAARIYLEEALNCYARWGARGKIIQLEKRHINLLMPIVPGPGFSTDDGKERDAGRSGAGILADTSLDLATVVKASQAMASEIELAPLLAKLVRIVIENAGAQRGALILERDGHWVIEAKGDMDGGNISVMQALDVAASEAVSAEIVSHVVRSRTSLVLDDAAGSGDFRHDTYVKRNGIKSVICAPLINQGKLSGIVYLENNLATHVFTGERLELLNLLSAQMALSLDNARLYQKAQEEIAERKAAEAALRESEERARTIFDSVNDGIIVHEMMSGYILNANRTACEMYGYGREELLRLQIEALSLNDAPLNDEGKRFFNKRMEEEGPQIFEWQARNKSGFPFWVEVSMRLAMIGGRQLVLVVVRDIGARKQMEAALQSSESVLRATMESISDGLLILSESGRVLHYNSRFMKIWSIPEGPSFVNDEQELLEYVLPQLVEPEHFINQGRQIHAGSDRTEDLLHLKDGRIIERFSYLMERTGEKPGRVWLFRDVTERRKAVEQIQRMNEELERRVTERTAALLAANRELEAFSYSVSHDLRTPLRAIDGYTRILLDEYAQLLDAEGVRFCGVIRSQTQRMGKLIDDLLAFSRFSRVGMERVAIDMEKMAKAVYLEVTTGEQRKRTEFRAEMIRAAVGDTTLLRQAWVNLLSNAVKFSSMRDQREIEVGSREEGSEVVYWVKDNGAGFDMQYGDKLFGVFQRLHSESEFEGTGVGLAIVQRIIHRHEGRIWAEGEIGKGATFYFSLPNKAV